VFADFGNTPGVHLYRITISSGAGHACERTRRAGTGHDALNQGGRTMLYVTTDEPQDAALALRQISSTLPAAGTPPASEREMAMTTNNAANKLAPQ
jgi:hypothetical protein